jgi:hypothetical protein
LRRSYKYDQLNRIVAAWRDATDWEDAAEV